MFRRDSRAGATPSRSSSVPLPLLLFAITKYQGLSMSFSKAPFTNLSLILLSSSALAQAPVAAPAPPPPPPPWVGAAQVSFLNTSGNTETSVLGLGAEAKYKGESPWSLALKAAFNQGSDGRRGKPQEPDGVGARRPRLEREDRFVPRNRLCPRHLRGHRFPVWRGVGNRAETHHHRKASAGRGGGLGFIHEVRLPEKIGKDLRRAARASTTSS